jgi:glycosyltransferase involved in cell wall biosynthesis
MTENLLLFNLATDADDPVLAFATEWLNRIARLYDHVDVITMRAGRLAVADNVRVYSVGKERGYSEARRAAEFYRLLTSLVMRRRYIACFAHMMPLFAAMSAPLVKAAGIRLVTWYTHRQVSRTLKLATRMSDRVVTASPDSFPIPTDKLRVLGHGIDADFYRPEYAELIDPLNPDDDTGGTRPRLSRTQEAVIKDGNYIVQVARLMPIKHQATLIHAIAPLEDARIVLVGGSPPDTDGVYEHKLRGLAHGLELGARVAFAGAQPPILVREYYHRAAIAVNLSPPGLFDKAALESMAMGLPTIVANPAFEGLLGDHRELLCLPSSEDVDGLTERLRRLLSLIPLERLAIGSSLRRRVLEQHSLSGLVIRLDQVLRTGEIKW